MRQINNWNDIKAVGEARELPVGGYVCKIMGAEVKTFDGKNGSFEQLHISIDVAEGEYKGFYAENYRAQNTEDKRWKGVVRLYLPVEDGSEKDGLTASILKGAIEAIEDSNSGYTWNWDEKTLKGKTVGCILRNEQWAFNGRTGWKAQPFKLIAADKIRSGDFKIPKEKGLAGQSAPAATSAPAGFEVVEDDDLPF